MPPGAIYVGRPSKWGNDFRVRQRCYDHLTEQFIFVEDAAHAVALYRAMWEHWLATDTLGGGRSPYHAFDRIRGHDLCCWCPLVDSAGNTIPCHADVLIELANG
jgi:hypothetical protein